LLLNNDGKTIARAYPTPYLDLHLIEAHPNFTLFKFTPFIQNQRIQHLYYLLLDPTPQDQCSFSAAALCMEQTQIQWSQRQPVSPWATALQQPTPPPPTTLLPTLHRHPLRPNLLLNGPPASVIAFPIVETVSSIHFCYFLYISLICCNWIGGFMKFVVNK